MIVLADIQQQYIGCYKNGGSRDRLMTGGSAVSVSMTLEMCQQYCQRSTGTYFGLQVSLNSASQLNLAYALCAASLQASILL